MRVALATDSIDVADDCARNHAVTLAARLSNDLTRDRTRDFYLTHDIDGSYRARVLARDRAHALVDALTPDRTGDPSAAVVLARRCAHALTQALTEARDRAHDRARGRADNLSRAFAHTRLDTATADITALRDLLNIVDTVTTDFIGADLRAASLKGIDLQRVRWSNTTKWPSGWEQRVRVQSREIAAGVFEVVGDGHEHIPVNWVTTP